MRYERTIIFGSLLVLSTSLLSGCNLPAKNPLANTPQSTAARALESASKSASESLHLSWGSNGYSDCMDGKHTEQACDAFYKAMLPYVKTNRLYGNLTLTELTDETMWKDLHGPYKEMLFAEVGS